MRRRDVPLVARVGPPLPAAPPPPYSPPRAPRERTWLAILALLLFAALIPESIATWNTPPLRMVVEPQSLPFLMAYYGSADLLIREAWRRRSLRRGALLMLGVAFGFVNEGIIANTWYSVTPTGYSLIHGVDYAWAVALTIFHAVMSTVVPILFVETLFPRLAARPWLGRKGIAAFAALFALVSSLGLINPTARAYLVYKPPVVAAIAALVVVALLLPRARPRALRAKLAPRLWALRLAGFAGYAAFFFALYAVPPMLARLVGDPGRATLLAIAVDLAFFFACLGVARRWTGRAGWGPRQALALISCALCLTIGLSVVHSEALAGGAPLLTLPFLALLVWMAWRTGRHKAATRSVSPPVRRDAVPPVATA